MNCWRTNVCQSCLSDNRTLFPLSKLQPILKELHFLQVINMMGEICWECRQIVLKICKFKNQVLRAQDILHRRLEINYLSNLRIETKNNFDCHFNYDDDPLINIGSELKNERDFVKEEQEIHGDDSNNDIVQYTETHDYDSISCGGIKNCKQEELDIKDFSNNTKNSEEIKNDMKKARSKLGNISKIKKDLEVEALKKKFVTVVFTEEEMVRNREEKRRQPNFKKIPYKCDLCVLGFTRKETYDLHIVKKHDESIGPYACQVCSTRFPTPGARERHAQRHYTCYRCRLCKYETVRRGAALAHSISKHAADECGRIHCDRCGFVARTPEDMSEHVRTQHTLYCNECGEKFKGKHTLRTHKSRIHKSKRDFICDLCTRTFNTKSRLESHMTSHTAALAQQLSYCGECGVQYKNIHVYRNHLRNSANHAERVYHCQDCNKKFASKVYWQKHCDFYHLKKSQFKCELCNKLFISDWRLKNHVQTHHGGNRTRNHVCNDCGKRFFTLSTLRAHYLTHSSQRSYMCEQCGDTFKQRAALHTHTRSLHAQTR